MPLVVWMNCAYTILSLEQLARHENVPITKVLPCEPGCYGDFIRACALNSVILPGSLLRRHVLHLLATLLLCTENSLPGLPALLEVDMFHYLLSLGFGMPSLYSEEQRIEKSEDDNTVFQYRDSLIPSGNTNDLYLVRLAFTAHLVQLLLTANFRSNEGETRNDESDSSLVAAYLKIRQAAILPNHHPTSDQLKTYIYESALPFLRCTAFFYAHITSVPYPAIEENAVGIEKEFFRICRYLGLPPDVGSFLVVDKSPMGNLISSWISKNRSYKGMAWEFPNPRPVNHLHPMPESYDDYFKEHIQFRCPQTNSLRSPCFCLLCGAVLCGSDECCYYEINGRIMGPLNFHAYHCGLGIGMFLDFFRKCERLQFIKQIFEKLQDSWLYQDIPNRIARAMEKGWPRSWYKY